MSSQPDLTFNFLWLERLRDAPNAVPTLVALVVVLVTVFIYQVSSRATFHNASGLCSPDTMDDTLSCALGSGLTEVGYVCH